MYTEELGVGDFLQEPHIAVIRALLLPFQPTFLDILPLYIVLLASFPLGPPARPRHGSCRSRSLGRVYALTLSQGWALHTRPSHEVWFFNPLAWQFLFVIGATAGHARISGGWPLPSSRWIGRAAIALAASSRSSI